MSGVVAWRVANHPPGPFALRKTKPIGWACIEPLVLKSDLDAAIARAEALERIGLELQGRAQRAESALSECYEWLFESKSDGPRVSEGALDNGSYTREFHALHERLRAAIAAQQAEGE